MGLVPSAPTTADVVKLLSLKPIPNAQKMFGTVGVTVMAFKHGYLDNYD